MKLKKLFSKRKDKEQRCVRDEDSNFDTDDLYYLQLASSRAEYGRRNIFKSFASYNDSHPVARSVQAHPGFAYEPPWDDNDRGHGSILQPVARHSEWHPVVLNNNSHPTLASDHWPPAPVRLSRRDLPPPSLFQPEPHDVEHWEDMPVLEDGSGWEDIKAQYRMPESLRTGRSEYGRQLATQRRQAVRQTGRDPRTNDNGVLRAPVRPPARSAKLVEDAKALLRCTENQLAACIELSRQSYLSATGFEEAQLDIAQLLAVADEFTREHALRVVESLSSTAQEMEAAINALWVAKEGLVDWHAFSKQTSVRRDTTRYRHARRKIAELQEEGRQRASDILECLSTTLEPLNGLVAVGEGADEAADEDYGFNYQPAEDELARECMACAETKQPHEFPDQPPTTRCQHPSTTCRTCLNSWIEAELGARSGTGLRCPECQQTMEHREIQAAASAKMFAAYERRVTLNALASLPEFAWCLSPRTCGSGQLNVDGNPFMICEACGYRQCTKHRMAWHDGETCRQYESRASTSTRAQDESRKIIEESKTEAMIGTVSKQCPGGCGWRLDKYEGCDHVRCTRCGYEFCWECLASWDGIQQWSNTAHRPDCRYHSNNVR